MFISILLENTKHLKAKIDILKYQNYNF